MKAAKFLAKSLLALALAGAAFAATSASAEVVLHRGNGGEPQTLDQAHTSIDVEANILKDLYEGLTVYDACRHHHPRHRRELDGVRRRPDLYLQAARRRQMVERRPRHGERFRLFLPAHRGPEDGGRLRQHPLSDQERRGDQHRQGRQGHGARPARREGGRRQDAGDHGRARDALFPRAAGPPDGAAGPSGERREVRRGLRQARQHGLRRRLHADRERRQRSHHAGQEPRTTTTPPTSRSTRSSTIRPRIRRPPSAASRPASSTCSTSSPPTRWPS